MWQGRSTWSAVCSQSRLANQSWIYGLKISSCWIFEHLTYERMSKWLVLLIIKRGPERRLTQFNLSGNFQLKLTLTQNASGKFAGSRASSRLKSTSTLKKKKITKKNRFNSESKPGVSRKNNNNTFEESSPLHFTPVCYILRHCYVSLKFTAPSPRREKNTPPVEEECRSRGAVLRDPPPPLTTHM